MLDSQARLPAAAASNWEESSFTRPMRSPFAGPAASDESTEVDIAIEETALFEDREPPVRPLRALRRTQTSPPPLRAATLPAPRFDAEATTKHVVSPNLLDAMRGERDSVRLLQAVRDIAPVDLSKTVEEPTLGDEVRLAQSGIRKRR